MMERPSKILAGFYNDLTGNGRHPDPEWDVIEKYIKFLESDRKALAIRAFEAGYETNAPGACGSDPVSFLNDFLKREKLEGE